MFTGLVMEINMLVYNFYNLTPEEIAIMEGRYEEL
jgi:hypothetical protein